MTKSDKPFITALGSFAAIYVLLIVLMLVADAVYGFGAVKLKSDDPGDVTLVSIFSDKAVLSSIRLTLFTCTLSAILSVLVAVPTGYLLARYDFPGKLLVSALLDIPIVLPPLVVGLSLLLLFNKFPSGESSIEHWLNKGGIKVTFNVAAVVLAQFSVACAFAVRTMRNTFDQISLRTEQVAQTLGCSRAGAFFRVVMPEVRRGISTAATLAWSRSMGEFGPILVFAGMIRNKTEVLSSTVYLEMTTGSLETAVIVSLLMVTIAMIVLVEVGIWDRKYESRLYHG